MGAHATPMGPNHPFVVWGSCFLWLASMFAIIWSLLLFFCVGDILMLTGTDIINAIVLLSGIIMLPTNVHILCSIANGKRIDHKSKVVCCPLWLCILWIILINALGAACCVQKICSGKRACDEKMNKTIKYYRNVPKYKHFVDNLQWSLKCCGLNSYKDWFDQDWYDKIRDYEWDPTINRRSGYRRRDLDSVTDSVPLSCCKSGSCISNYLLELGTHSIYTTGCGNLMYRIILASMIAHCIMFVSVILVEILILKFILKAAPKSKDKKGMNMNVRHIMSVNDNFASSNSLQINPDDTDYENEVHLGDVRMDTSRMTVANRVIVDDEDSESPKETKKWEEYDD
ncbi:peripherin-2-like [Helicoverpa zea]|uniref:peripherin-2-like n=1 Tax=Helicoverpa zea TaxID=7113 RepID=UPI001F57A773|nr:peripherin-2-like [Helicoverpa zea]